MRTAVNVVIILVLAVGAGLVLRSLREPLGEQTSEPLGSSEPIRFDEDAAGEQMPADDTELGTHPEPAGAEPGAGNEELAKTGWITEFELTERSGETISSRDLRGAPYVASFFFAKCPSVCKLQNEKMRQLQEEFAGEPIRFVAITVDPENDTPAALREYAKRYDADPEQWLFFTGDLTYIRRVGGEMYGLPVAEQLHTESFVLVGADGKVKAIYKWSDPGQFRQLRKDIRERLDVSATAAAETS
jgi:protein SCO1/2